MAYFLTEKDKISEELILSALKKLEILPAIYNTANKDETLAIEDLEKSVDVDIVDELPLGAQVPIRDVTVLDSEELKVDKTQAKAIAFKSKFSASTADLKKLEEAKDLNVDQFLSSIGGKFRMPVKSILKSIEITLQGTDEDFVVGESIPSLYQLTKQGMFGGLDGEKYPAWNPQYLEVAGDKNGTFNDSGESGFP